MLRRSSTSPQAGSVPVFSGCYPVSRRLTDLPRHFTKLREQDLPWSNRQPGLGAVDRLFDEKDRQTTIRVLLRSASLQPISTSLQFECCTSSSRSFRRNQDRSKVVETPCRTPYGCTDYIYHVGSIWDYRSVVDARLTTGPNGNKRGRQTCLFAAITQSSMRFLRRLSI